MKKIYNFNDFKINEELDFNPIPCSYTSGNTIYNNINGCLRGGVKFSTGGYSPRTSNACRVCEIQTPTVKVRIREESAFVSQF